MNLSQKLISLLDRKMVMFYLTLTAVFLLSVWGKLAGDNIMIAIGWIVTTFVIGNVGEWKYKSGSIDTSVGALLHDKKS